MFVAVKVKVAKKWRQDAEAMARLGAPLAVGAVLAEWIRKRVTQQAQTIPTWQPWAPVKEWKSAVHVNQADQLRVPKSRRLSYFRDNQGNLMVLCLFVRKNPQGHGGTYVNTGGMWSGLTVSAWGGKSVKVTFGGSSWGNGEMRRNIQKASMVLEPLTEGNSSARGKGVELQGGGRLFIDQETGRSRTLAPRKNRINLLRLRQDEVDAVGAAYGEVILRLGQICLGDAVSGRVSAAKGNATLFGLLVNALKQASQV